MEEEHPIYVTGVSCGGSAPISPKPRCIRGSELSLRSGLGVEGGGKETIGEGAGHGDVDADERDALEGPTPPSFPPIFLSNLPAR